MFNIHKHQFDIPKTGQIIYGRGSFLVLGCSKCSKSKRVMISHQQWTMGEIMAYCEARYDMSLVIRNVRPLYI